MADLTREEIRRAVESLPEWEWHEGVAYEPSTGYNRPRFRDGDDWTLDAIALLKATGGPFQIHYFPGRHGTDWWEVPIHASDDGLSAKGFWMDENLPTAAVRAVNAWAERKESP